MRDPDTGNSRGFGFISYDSFEASDAAIEVCTPLCSFLWYFPYPFGNPSLKTNDGSTRIFTSCPSTMHLSLFLVPVLHLSLKEKKKRFGNLSFQGYRATKECIIAIGPVPGQDHIEITFLVRSSNGTTKKDAYFLKYPYT